MRKEKIEKVPPASVDHSDIEAAQESLQSPLTTPVVAARDPLGVTTVESVMVSAQPSTPSGDQCKTETADGEPPRKRGRYGIYHKYFLDIWCLFTGISLNTGLFSW